MAVWRSSLWGGEGERGLWDPREGDRLMSWRARLGVQRVRRKMLRMADILVGDRFMQDVSCESGAGGNSSEGGQSIRLERWN